MSAEVNTHTVHRYDDRLGDRTEETAANLMAGFDRQKSDYDDLIDEKFFDVLYHNTDVYRVFWNKELFADVASLRKIVTQENVVAVIYIKSLQEANDRQERAHQ